MKKSSIMFALGFMRLVLVTLTNYRFSYSEYGLHWNFFFTIFFVKLFACPFDLVTRRSSSRSFLLSLGIGLAYQYLLSARHYSEYILDRELKRVTFIDQNKEGIFSTIGYLSIYFAGEAVCYRLKHLIKQR
jgi:phosphatidylinositol glycan class W